MRMVYAVSMTMRHVLTTRVRRNKNEWDKTKGRERERDGIGEKVSPTFSVCHGESEKEGFERREKTNEN